jgi:hypothetical protein
VCPLFIKTHPGALFRSVQCRRVAENALSLQIGTFPSSIDTSLRSENYSSMQSINAFCKHIRVCLLICIGLRTHAVSPVIESCARMMCTRVNQSILHQCNLKPYFSSVEMKKGRGGALDLQLPGEAPERGSDDGDCADADVVRVCAANVPAN